MSADESAFPDGDRPEAGVNAVDPKQTPQGSADGMAFQLDRGGQEEPQRENR